MLIPVKISEEGFLSLHRVARLYGRRSRGHRRVVGGLKSAVHVSD